MENFYEVEIYQASSDQWSLVCKQKSYESAMKMADEARKSIGYGRRYVRVSLNGETVQSDL
jgi:hypothetical protein